MFIASLFNRLKWGAKSIPSFAPDFEEWKEPLAPTESAVVSMNGGTGVPLPRRKARAMRERSGRTLLEIVQLEDRVTPTLGTTALLEGPDAGTDSDIVSVAGAWTAASNAAWLHTSSSGAGNGLAQFTFDTNTGATRTGTLTIAGDTLTVIQAGNSYVAANPVTLLAPLLSHPQGVAVDGSGNVYIADSANNAIRKWNAATQTLTTLVSSGLNNPGHVAVDGLGNVYFADQGNKAIKEWHATTNTVSTLVSSGLTNPRSVAVDSSGNVYFADFGNKAIYKWNAATQTIATLISTGLNIPQGVAVDSSGNVYFADSGNKTINEWSAATQSVTTLISTGLNVPQGVAVDSSGNIYFADNGNNAIYEWSAATQSVTPLISSGLNSPIGVAVDGSGNVYIADSANNAIKEWNAATNTVNILVSPTVELLNPYGVAVDGSGNVYIADAGINAIKEWNATTQSVTILVSSGLSGPSGVAVDGAGNVYIADTGNNVIKKWNAATQSVSNLVSSGLSSPYGVALDGLGNVYIGDAANNAVKEWHAATQSVTTLVSSGLNSPRGVAVDGSGNVYIADRTNSAIKKWNAATNTVSTLATPALPYGVAVDGSGNVYITSFSVIAGKWNAATNTFSSLSLNIFGPTAQRGVTVDGSGNVYLTDPSNNSLKELPRAFVPSSALSVGAASGSAALAPVLPATTSLTGVFAPTSDQGWLTIGSIANGVVNVSFTQNMGPPRTANLTVLGQPITVAQEGALLGTPTTTTLTAAPDATTTGQLVSFTATVAPATAGTVTFLDNGVPIASGANVALAGGVATFQISTLSTGTHPITAKYSGATGFAASTSNTVPFVVSPAVTTTTLTATPNATSVGQQVTFTATVGPSPGNLGTVTFKDNGAVIAPNVPVVAGVAIFQTSTLTVGTHSISADYSGTTSFVADSSNAVPFAVSLPGTLTVNTTADVLGHAGGQLSLRQAVLDANDNSLQPGADVITFAPGLSGMITLGGEIRMTSDITVTGPGADKLTISGGGSTRIFNISGASTTVAISGLTIANGKATGDTAPDTGSGPVTLGGGIYNNGSHLILSDSVFTNNQVAAKGNEQAAGGAIANEFGASLTVDHCTFTGNIARGAGTTGQGAIVNDAGSNAVIDHSTFTGNQAFGGANGSYGGALGNYDGSDMKVSNSDFNNNLARGLDAGLAGTGGGAGQGGAIDFEDFGYFKASKATLTIANCSFSSNQAVNGQGNGSANYGGGGALCIGTSSATAVLTISDSTFDGNQAKGGNGAQGGLATGGALFVFGNGSTVRISGSSFHGNQAQGGDGASGVGGDGTGGAVCINSGAEFTVSSSVFDGDQASGGLGLSGEGLGNGGAIDSSIAVTMTNSTISGNSATNEGGGIWTGGLLTVTNSTVVLNSADSDGNGFGSGGGINNGTVAPVLQNTMIAGNKLLENGGIPSDIRGFAAVNPVSSFNLIGDAATAGGLVDNVNGNIVGVNGTGVRDIATIINTTLANNGGPTLTHALIAGSPAIDEGSNALVPAGVTTDRRGAPFARSNGVVDIGAYEAQNTTATTLTAIPLATTGGTTVMFTATVAPSPGSFGTVSFLDGGVPIPGGSNVAVVGGVAVFSTTLSVGSHPITASYSGVTGFAASASSVLTVVVTTGAAPPKVVSVTPNGGLTNLAGNQRSRIVDLTVIFDQPVALDPNAMTVALHTNNVSLGGVPQPFGFGSLPTTLALNSTDKMTWVITFVGNTDVGADGFNSLKDGVYDLNIDAAKVHPDGVSGVNMAASSVTTFHRLFGDTGLPDTPSGGTAGVDFQAIVNTGDNLSFRGAFNNPLNYNAALDFNGDGTINSGDNLPFRNRFNKVLTWRM